MRRATVLLLGAVLCGFAGDNGKSDPTRIGNRDVGRGINLYSLEKEIALGRQLAQEVQRQAKILDDATIGEYVNRIGQNLARNSDAKVPFVFQVIEDDKLNAFALPGGFIFVHTGLLKAAETEAELASAMAHEVAHVAARHMTRQATRGQIAGLLSNALWVLGGWTGYAVRQGAGVGIPLTFLSFGRGFESEADYLGVQYTYAAGYDPTAAVDLFERMQSLEIRKPGTIAGVFATHPPSGARMHKVQREIQEILPAKPVYVINTSEYIGMRARLFDIENRRKRAASGQDPADPPVPGHKKARPGGLADIFNTRGRNLGPGAHV